ncbi:hypothetical protein [Nocardiopsis sp. YSL2]|uniref:hypothetical protein n=1 Tax=Nocardiopsis sp. YSL2 TaxID=2939492 RepID=UPI0026F45B2F|nr:hypothetical protein [Nocardiopsis sp. YSL2]
MSYEPAITDFTATCWECGQPIQHTGGIADPAHVCKPEDATRWAAYLEGWHDGYRQAAENPADPMVMADRAAYGTGWAGVMRTGEFSISGCADQEAPGE